MKIFTKIATVFITLSLIISALVIPASAAKSAVIYFSKNTIEVGEKVTVSVSINPNEEMYAVEFYLEYNENLLNYVSGASIVDTAGVLHVVESYTGEKKVKFDFTFIAKNVGTDQIKVNDCVYEILGNNGAETKKFGGASAKMTIKDPALSKNANLKSLKVSGYSLSPSFSSSKTSYSVKVPYDVTKLNVTATTQDENAKVTAVTGNSKLKVGKNTVTVTVQAENGTQKKYTINVTRLEENATDTEEEDESQDSALQTTIDGATHLIVTKLPKDVIFKGFTIETTKVNGYEIETAVDKEGFYRIFYLQSPDSDKLTPYLYDETLDEFEKLKYTIQNDILYIFSEIPEDFQAPEALYESNIDINGFLVKCLSDPNAEMSEFHYIYCYANGTYNLYRYDSFEGTLQRQPDFEFITVVQKENPDNFFTRFSSLTTNAKIILIGIVIVVLGVLALLILLILYLFRKSVAQNDGVLLSANDVYFDEIDLQNNEKNFK